MRDVKIAFVKEKKSSDSVSFTFENDISGRLGSEYIFPVVIDDRLYFEPTVKHRGVKLGDKGYKKSTRMCLPTDELKEFAPFIGERTIYFDKILNCCYVNKSVNETEFPELIDKKEGTMKEQAIFLPELNWFSRQTGGSDATADISVSVVKGSNHNNKKSVAFTLRENALKHFTSEYLTFAINKNRIFFKRCTAKEGYKIVIRKTNGYIKATLDSSAEEVLKNFIGDYELKFDKYYELYYIEKAED